MRSLDTHSLSRAVERFNLNVDAADRELARIRRVILHGTRYGEVRPVGVSVSSLGHRCDRYQFIINGELASVIFDPQTEKIVTLYPAARPWR